MHNIILEDGSCMRERIYNYMYVFYICVYMCIYIYRERERARESDVSINGQNHCIRGSECNTVMAKIQRARYKKGLRSESRAVQND